MNTTNFLLGTTCTLLVVGFALSFSGLTNSRRSDSDKKELAALKQELEKMDAEEHAFKVAHLRSSSAPYTPSTLTTPLPTPNHTPEIKPDPITADMKAILESQQKRIDDLENQNQDLAIENTSLETENEEIFEEKKESQDEDRMAAFRVKNALSMGTVTTADKSNALVIFTPTASSSFEPGRILAVRRNTGIIGKIEINRLDGSGEYVATMRPHGYSPDGYPDIQPGDTIITDFEG